MIQGSQITALLKMAGERSDRPWRAMTPTPQSLGAAATGTLLTPDNLYRFREIISFTHMQTLLTLFSFFFLQFPDFNIRWRESRKMQQHIYSPTHMHTQTYRSQTAHCALWPSMGRVGLGSSGNREDRPSPLSHNEGLITGPASLKSHGSRLPVSVLRSPNILIALLFSLCFYCASLPDSLLLSPQPFHT